MLKHLQFRQIADSYTLMILTEKKSARASALDNKFKRISSSYFEIANSEKVVLGYINKMMEYFVAH